ncbi:hypothetical protein JL720_6218 [Aureococcus anophagefferens]|nr:hypothetical protein JL720_6218 [Aureococcus anophagefferens]
MKKLLEELSMGGFYEPLIQCGVMSIQVLQDEGLISNDELENRIGMGFVHVRKPPPASGLSHPPHTNP